MQSAPDNSNVDNSESTFDFLGDRTPGTVDMSSVDSNSQKAEPNDSKSSRRRTSSTARTTGKPFPVIRKPVSVEESGALRPPLPGAPVEPPPPLTDGMRAIDPPNVRANEVDLDIPDLNKFDFDDDDWPDSGQWVDRSLRARYPDNGTARTGRASGVRRVLYVAAFLLIGGGIVSALYTVPSVQSRAKDTLAVLSSQATDALGSIKDSIRGRLDGGIEQASGPDEPVNSVTFEPDPTSLNARFRSQLANLETLIDQGELDQADQVLQNMDRSVFGYGAPEFSQISDRISAIRQGGDGAVRATSDSEAQAELLAEQQAEQTRAAEAQLQVQQEQAAAEARRQAQQEQAAEAQRQAQQEQAAEAQRQAQQEQAAAEARRQAQQEQAAAEAQRQAQQEQAAVEAQRQAQQEQAAAEAQRQAQQAEADRIARQQQAAAEQAQAAERQAEQERAAAESRRLAEQRAAEAEQQIRADRLAQEQARQEQLELARQQRALANQPPAVPGSESANIRDIAAQQREAARQRRLLEARQRDEQINQAADTGDINVVVQAPAIDVPDNEIALAETGDDVSESRRIQSQPITDADLQQVYQQFSSLRDAIESRDIDAVLRLTERSGVRIQQVLQMFENNVSISARLRNVSTLDSTGEIQGVLQITRLERADGSVTGPPLNLGSVPLSAVREDNGWSPIRW